MSVSSCLQGEWLNCSFNVDIKCCTCSRMQQMSRWVSRAWSRLQFPEVTGEMTNSSSEADWLCSERRPRLLRVLCWKELMLWTDTKKERWVVLHWCSVFYWLFSVIWKLTRCLLASGCPNRRCHPLRWSHVTRSRSCRGPLPRPGSPLMMSFSAGRGHSGGEHAHVHKEH